VLASFVPTIGVIVGPPLVRRNSADLAVDSCPTAGPISTGRARTARTQLTRSSGGIAPSPSSRYWHPLRRPRATWMASLPERTDALTQQLLKILLDTLGGRARPHRPA
jgi:hypothetical protein